MPEEKDLEKILNPWQGIRADEPGKEPVEVDIEEEAEKAGLLSKADKIAGVVPIGTILPYLGGFFADDKNGDFSMVMAKHNTIDAVNELLGPDGFRVCDGTFYYDKDSPIFKEAGRRLPNLTADLFLMGDGFVGCFYIMRVR